jgi:hypothetical protein
VTDEPLNQPEDTSEFEEVVDGLPVLAEETRVIEIRQTQVPAVHAAALAATGFVAGAATVALVHRHRVKSAPKKRGKKRQAIGEIVTSNSFLVDVHLLRRD